LQRYAATLLFLVQQRISPANVLTYRANSSCRTRVCSRTMLLELYPMRWHCVVVLTGRITGLACPSVCLFRTSFWLESKETAIMV